MNEFTINTDTVITIAAVLSAIVAIFGAIFALYRWYLRQNKHNEKYRSKCSSAQCHADRCNYCI